MDKKFVVNYVSLGEKIRRKRLSMGLSQETVSEKINISESFYGHIERGDRVLSIESLVKIANFLNLNPDYLLLDSTSAQSDSSKMLQTELDNIFRDKTPEQSAYLLNLLKVLSDNIERLQI